MSRLRYTAALAERICERIASGETLVAVCRTKGHPNISTVLRWLAPSSPHAAFRELYARAKEIRLEVMAEEIQQISDESRPGERRKEKHLAWICPVCRASVRWQGKLWVHSEAGTPMCEGAPKPEELTEIEVVTADMVERDKLRIDARKWLLARLAAKTYGDRVATEVSGPGGAVLNLIVRSAKDQPAE